VWALQSLMPDYNTSLLAHLRRRMLSHLIVNVNAYSGEIVH
jgi:hypothetical protein